MDENFNLYFIIFWINTYSNYEHIEYNFITYTHTYMYICVYVSFFRSLRMRISWKYDSRLKLYDRDPQIKKSENKNEAENFLKSRLLRILKTRKQ